MTIDRRIEESVKKDLEKKMVFIAGPRQCGKTTLAKKILKDYKGEYYNWDKDEHRKLIRNNKLDHDKELWIFDELHKYKAWRNWLKGNYDLFNDSKKILVAGSAKLDFYNRGGDSLQGRYFLHRLHPFTLSELLKLDFCIPYEKIPNLEIESKKTYQNSLIELMDFGGFPEPLFSGSMSQAKRWRASYGTRLIREDIRDLQLIRELDKMELLYEHLPSTVGSVLSINSLRGDLEVNHLSVKNWIGIFENNYACFRLPPFGAPKLKAVKKEQKLYFWDWGLVKDESKRFENLLALHLLRFCHWVYDNEGENLELRYFRDTVGHEVDFVILKNKKPWIAIEAKLSETDLDSNLVYLLKRVKIPYAFQLHLHGKRYTKAPDINGSKVFILPAEKFLINLP